VTIHSGEQNELEDVIENTKLKILRPTEIPLKLRHTKIEPETQQEPIWDLTKKNFLVP
jgi:hypothetical protein